ncbi:MAG TPA: S-adenosylmethionine:tRNA ribosyltransferase-isomerase, partial [bacterium]|nr:S-adenosylmethionine:tRNA ribosyltransferase-isomerase [bacterium]
MKSINLSLEDFNYNLPKHLIAQTPIKPRDHARLLCLGRF